MLSIPTTTSRFGDLSPLDAMQASQMDFSLFQIGTRNPQGTPLQSPSGSVSKLDLKAPGKARREYEQGYRLLNAEGSAGCGGALNKIDRHLSEFCGSA